MSETAPEGPRLKDSDLVWLTIKRLERVAQKMQQFEYDEELDAHLADADEWLDYLTSVIESRKETSDA